MRAMEPLLSVQGLANRFTPGAAPVCENVSFTLARWRRANLGFVFQAFHVLPHPSVAENVALPLLLLGWPEPQRLAAMLDAVGLADARGLWVNPRGGGPDSFGLQGRVGPGLASR